MCSKETVGISTCLASRPLLIADADHCGGRTQTEKTGFGALDDLHGDGVALKAQLRQRTGNGLFLGLTGNLDRFCHAVFSCLFFGGGLCPGGGLCLVGGGRSLVYWCHFTVSAGVAVLLIGAARVIAAGTHLRGALLVGLLAGFPALGGLSLGPRGSALGLQPTLAGVGAFDLGRRLFARRPRRAFFLPPPMRAAIRASRSAASASSTFLKWLLTTSSWMMAKTRVGDPVVPMAAGMMKQIYTDMRGIMRFMLRIMLACSGATCWPLLVTFISSQDKKAEDEGDEKQPRAGPQSATVSAQLTLAKKFSWGKSQRFMLGIEVEVQHPRHGGAESRHNTRRYCPLWQAPGRHGGELYAVGGDEICKVSICSEVRRMTWVSGARTTLYRAMRMGNGMIAPQAAGHGVDLLVLIELGHLLLIHSAVAAMLFLQLLDKGSQGCSCASCCACSSAGRAA
jgi:hypothetical protein